MFRSISTAILILAGAVLLCLLVLRLVVSALFALSGIRRRAREQVLSW
jgi:flagellar biosynthesis protein FliQ